MFNHFRRIALTEVQELNIPVDPCNKDKGYNFSSCVRKILAEQVIIDDKRATVNILKVGCRTLWDRWNGPGVANCTTGDQYRSHNPFCSAFTTFFRKHDSILKVLSRGDLTEITRVTGCLKPCSYKKYVLIGEKTRTSFKSDDFTFSLWAVSNSTFGKH